MARADYDADGRYSSMADTFPGIWKIAADLADLTGIQATHIAFQAYRDGQAVTPWHDDRTMTGDSMILSVGATRRFQIRPYNGSTFGEAVHLYLPHDSLIVLPADFHDYYQHRIGREGDVSTERYSFVFRTPARK